MMKYIFIFLVSNSMIAQTVSTFISDESVTITDAIVFDENGNLFGSDFSGDTVFKVTPTGDATPFVTGLENPNGLAFDSEGNLFVAEYGGGKIHKYDSTGDLLTTYTVSGIPSGMIKAFDSDDMIFTMVSNNSINRLSTSTGAVTELYQGTPLNIPVGLAYDDIGNLYSGNYIGRQIYKIDSTTTYVATVPNGGSSSFLAFITYGNGKLFGSVFFGGHKIYTINPNEIDNTTLLAGTVQGSTDGNIDVASFDNPSGLTYVASENALYVSEFTINGNIRKIEEIPLSVNDFSSEVQAVLSPNPSNDIVKIAGTSNEPLGDTKILVYDATGALVNAVSQIIYDNIFDIQLDISKLQIGIYTINIQSDDGRTLTKSVVKR